MCNGEPGPNINKNIMPSATGGNVCGMSIANVSMSVLPLNSFVAKIYAKGTPNSTAKIMVTMAEVMLSDKAVKILSLPSVAMTCFHDPRAAIYW